MKDNRSKLQIYIAAVKRLYMWHLLQEKYGLILLTEFPKSGGSWFCTMFSDATGIPFPRNVSPKFEQCILHGHHLYHPRMAKAICLMRDGRDVMVSAYFHFLFEGEKGYNNVNELRRNLGFKNYDNISENMPQFIEYMFSGYANKNMFHFSWSDMVQNIIKYKDKICVLKYEDLLISPVQCLEKALSYYGIEFPGERKLNEIVEKYSFKNVTKRNPGEEDRKSFVRKGISGDWKNHFTEEACEVFKKYAGEELIKMGYEKDLNWSNSIKN